MASNPNLSREKETGEIVSTENQAPDEWGSLANQLDEDYPRSWRPGKLAKDAPKGAAPDALEIMGTVVRVDRQSVEFQGRVRPVEVLVLATHPEGELRAVWAIHKTLAEDVARQGISDGDRVAIRYLGFVEAKDGENKYHAYKLAVRRSTSGIAAPAMAPAVRPDFGDEPPE